MRKKLLILFMSVMCVSLGGCLVEELPLTDREIGIVAEYAADTLLRHDRNYNSILLSEEALTPTPTTSETPETSPEPVEQQDPTETPDPTGEPEKQLPTEIPEPTETPEPTEKPEPTEFPENTEITNEELGSVIGAWDGLYAEYKGASEPVKSFTMGASVQGLLPCDGYEYIITKFSITNESDSVTYLNTFSQHLTCVLFYNGKHAVLPETTFFTNDLREIGVPEAGQEWSFGLPIEPGKAYDALLAFKVPEYTVFDSAGIVLTNEAGESVSIKIK